MKIIPPGFSLTQTPGNAPFERPPEIVDPMEATRLHVESLNDPEKMEAIVDVLEMGVDIRTIVEGLTRNAVMQGIHTVDVSLLVAPVLHELIKGNADALGVEYKEGFEKDPKEEKRMMYQRDVAKARHTLKKMQLEPEEAAPPLEPPMEEEAMEVAPKGLMARRTQ